MSSPHAVLRPAERARVIASLSTPASWIPADGGEPLHLPFIDQAGTPLLLVPTDLASELREAGLIRAALRPVPVLGTLTLTGRIRALEPGEGTEQIAEYRLNHADCGPACGEPASTVVALELTAIELTDPQHLEAEWIPLDDYQSAELDRVVAEAYVVAAHLNEHHAEDLLRLAGLLTSGHPEILAAAIQSVDRAGLVLTVINSSGAHDLDLTFRFPVTPVGDLGSQLHHLLEDPTAYLRA